MLDLKQLTEEIYGVLREQFKEADIWEGDEDLPFVRGIAEDIAAERLVLLSGDEVERNAAIENLKFLKQTVRNRITEKQIKLQGFGDRVLVAIVDTLVQVLIKAAIAAI